MSSLQENDFMNAYLVRVLLFTPLPLWNSHEPRLLIWQIMESIVAQDS